jgi:hypothetical protein
MVEELNVGSTDRGGESGSHRGASGVVGRV